MVFDNKKVTREHGKRCFYSIAAAPEGSTTLFGKVIGHDEYRRDERLVVLYNREIRDGIFAKSRVYTNTRPVEIKRPLGQICIGDSREGAVSLSNIHMHNMCVCVETEIVKK